MATVVRRTFAATPVRTGSETWNAISELLAPEEKSAARTELNNVHGVAASCIASEATKDDPIVIYGNGPLVRVYCVFDADAVSGDDVDESSLAQCPTEGDWKMSLPCPKEDVDWMQKKLKSISSRITARAAGEDVEYEKSTSSAKANAQLSVNVTEFFRK